MNILRFGLLAAIFGLPLAAVPAHALITFGPPAALNSTAATDSDVPSAEDVDGEVSLASSGVNWVAVWASDNSLGGSIGDDFDILVSTSADDGETWSPAAAAMADAATDVLASDTSPKVGAGNGVFVTVFSSNNTLGGTKGSDEDILFTRSTNNGATWSNAALLNSGGTIDGTLELDVQPAIATNGSGTWVVVWRHNTLGGMNPTGSQVFFSYSTNNGVTWAAEQALGGFQSGTGLGNGQGTAVAWNGTGFVAAWGSSQNLASNGNDGDILSSVIAVPGFTASSAVLVNDSGTSDSSTGADQYPALAANGSTVIATWESNANVGGAGLDHDILFARSTNGGASWSSAAALQSNATTDTGDDNNVAIANDGATFFAVWDSTDPLDGLAKSDRDIFVVRSDDAGLSWSPTAVLATTAAKDKGADIEPSVAVNPSTGSWNVAWQSTDTLGKTIGTDKDVLYVHSSRDCPALPVAAASCFQPTASGASSLIIKEGGSKDAFLWKFVKGPLVDKATDLGSPNSSDDYVLCVYDEASGTPELISELDIEAGGNCYVNPCWTDVGVGYTYKHKAGVVASASLTAGAAGTSKASVKAKGAYSAPPLPLALDTTVKVRLHNLANGRCFANDFTQASTNTAGLFKAKSSN